MDLSSTLRERSPRRKGWGWLLALAAVLPGCSKDAQPPGGGGGPDGGNGPLIVRVDVAPGSLLLTAPGQTHTLTAKAFDAQGTEVATAFTWTSSRPAEVTVDAAGRVSAAALGSAQVTASAGGVSSAAATVLVAEPAPGALLVADAQVVSVGPVTFTPADGPGPGLQYEVRLRGISPAPAAGTIVLASESAQVAGKVVSTRDESGTLVATLELRPMYEVLRRYHIDWNLEVAPYAPEELQLRTAPPGVPEVQDGRSGALSRRSPADRLLRPFTAVDCDGSVEGSLFKKSVTLTPNSSLDWQVQEFRDDPDRPPSYVKHALVGALSLTGSIELGLNAEITVSGTCRAQLPPIRIAAFGAASVLVMPAIRVGVGVDLSGALHVAKGAVGISGTVGLQASIGWECGGPAGAGCRGIHDLSEIKDVKPKFEVPSIHQMKVKLDAQLYAFVGLDLAVLGGLGGYFGVAEAKLGPKQSGTFGFEDDQAHEPDRSSYDLSISGSIGPGPGLSAAIKKVIDDDTVSVNLNQDIPPRKLSESPKGTLTVDKERTGINEQVKFTVNIAPETANYLGIGYNVVAIQIWRRPPGEDTFEHMEELDIFPSASAQTQFEKTWKPKAEHVGKNEFAAFVHTEVHDTGLLPLLEVADDSRKQVDVQAICSSGLRSLPGMPGLVVEQQGGDCTVAGTLRHVVRTEAPGTDTTSTGQASVHFTQDPASGGGTTIVFHPEGTCSLVLTGTAGGCTYDATSTFCAIDTDRSGLAVVIDSTTDPPTYRYNALVGANVTLHETIICPESAPIVVDVPTTESLMMAPQSENFTVASDGRTLQNSYTQGGGGITHTWTWDLALDIPPSP